MNRPIRKLDPPPDVPDLHEFPAIVEPAIQDLPPPDEPPIEGFEPFRSAPVRSEMPAPLSLRTPDGSAAAASAADLARRVDAVVSEDERVRALVEGKRSRVLGTGPRLDERRPDAAHTVVLLYDYTEGRGHEVLVDGDGDDLRVADIRRTVEQPPLCDEEIAEATELARGDRRVAARLEPGFVPMVLLTSAVEHGDEHYGRRRAYVGFGPPDERLPRVRAIVDLGSREVVAVDRGAPRGEPR